MPNNDELLERFSQGDEKILNALIACDTGLFINLLELAAIRKADPNIKQDVFKDEVAQYYYTRELDYLLSCGLRKLYQRISKQSNFWSVVDDILNAWEKLSHRFEDDVDHDAKRFSDALQKAWEEKDEDGFEYLEGEWRDPIDMDIVADALFDDGAAISKSVGDPISCIRRWLSSCQIYILKCVQVDHQQEFIGHKMEVFSFVLEDIEDDWDLFSQWMDKDGFSDGDRFSKEDINNIISSHYAILEHGRRIVGLKAGLDRSSNCDLD